MQSVILTHPGCRLGATLFFQLPCQLLRMPGALRPPLLILLQVLGPLHSVLAITKLVFGGWILPVHACRTVIPRFDSFHHWIYVFPKGQVHFDLGSPMSAGRELFAPLGESAWSWLRSKALTLHMGDGLHAKQCTQMQQDTQMTCSREKFAWSQAKARTWPAIGPNEGHKQLTLMRATSNWPQ